MSARDDPGANLVLRTLSNPPARPSGAISGRRLAGRGAETQRHERPAQARRLHRLCARGRISRAGRRRPAPPVLTLQRLAGEPKLARSAKLSRVHQDDFRVLERRDAQDRFACYRGAVARL
jgi:hypothetical protein